MLLIEISQIYWLFEMKWKEKSKFDKLWKVWFCKNSSLPNNSINFYTSFFLYD